MLCCHATSNSSVCTIQFVKILQEILVMCDGVNCFWVYEPAVFGAFTSAALVHLNWQCFECSTLVFGASRKQLGSKNANWCHRGEHLQQPKTSTTNTNSNSDTNINPKTKCWKFTVFCPWGSNWKPNKNTKQSRDNNKLVNSAKNPGSQRIPPILTNWIPWAWIGPKLVDHSRFEAYHETHLWFCGDVADASSYYSVKYHSK